MNQKINLTLIQRSNDRYQEIFDKNGGATSY